MKTKQLANVLIKILGLSVIVHGIPSFITGFIPMLQGIGSSSSKGLYWLYLCASVILIVIGIYFVVKSRDVAAFLFKDEDE
jgi:uncharacterized membrane protein